MSSTCLVCNIHSHYFSSEIWGEAEDVRGAKEEIAHPRARRSLYFLRTLYILIFILSPRCRNDECLRAGCLNFNYVPDVDVFLTNIHAMFEL